MGFLQLFYKSPFGGLQEHIKLSRECVDQLPLLIKSIMDGDYKRMEELADRIQKLEGKADAVKNEIRNNLPSNIFLPVARPDLIQLLHDLDSIPDIVEDIAMLFTLRRMEIPEDMKKPIAEFVSVVTKVFQMASNVLMSFEDLKSAAFSGKEMMEIHERIAAINLAEHEADIVQFELVKKLLDYEDDLKPIAIFWWLKIFNKLGDLANKSENIGDRLRTMIAA